MSRLSAVTMLVAVTVSMLTLGGPAHAHERRMVGPYQLVVGFLAEPAFAGAVNGVDLRVTDTRANPPRNVEGLQDGVTVEVFHGGLGPLPLKLRARFGQPGAYAADFIPTRAGAYRLVFKGKIEQTDLTEKDGTFESGPGRFNDVEATTALQYPDKVPGGADLSDRLSALERDIGSARAFALVAIAVAIALGVGGALRARRRA